MTKLVPSCTGCCVRRITYNAVISSTHTPRSVQENDKYKILWDFLTEKKRGTDIVCISKQKRECQIISFAIPGDQNIDK